MERRDPRSDIFIGRIFYYYQGQVYKQGSSSRRLDGTVLW